MVKKKESVFKGAYSWVMLAIVGLAMGMIISNTINIAKLDGSEKLRRERYDYVISLETKNIHFLYDTFFTLFESSYRDHEYQPNKLDSLIKVAYDLTVVRSLESYLALTDQEAHAVQVANTRVNKKTYRKIVGDLKRIYRNRTNGQRLIKILEFCSKTARNQVFDFKEEFTEYLNDRGIL